MPCYMTEDEYPISSSLHVISGVIPADFAYVKYHITSRVSKLFAPYLQWGSAFWHFFSTTVFAGLSFLTMVARGNDTKFYFAHIEFFNI